MDLRFPAVFLVCLALQYFILWWTEFPTKTNIRPRAHRWLIPVYSLRFFGEGMFRLNDPVQPSSEELFLLGGLVLAGWALAWVIYILWDIYDRNKR